MKVTIVQIVIGAFGTISKGLFCGQLRQQSQQFCKFSFLMIIIMSGPLANYFFFVTPLEFFPSVLADIFSLEF